MLRPTEEQIDAAKAECRRRFGHARLVGVTIGAPVDLFCVVAAMGLREASADHDARVESIVQAQSAFVIDRLLWPALSEVAALRATFPALDAQITETARKALGFTEARASALVFSAATAPPGFAAAGELAAKVAELQSAHPAAKLWSVSNRANGLSLVMAAPSEDIYCAARAAAEAANTSKRGGLTVILDFARDLVVWSPKPLDVHLDEMPGRAEDIAGPFFEMGGAGASASASFL